jgi:hypothetical protein
MIMPAPGVLLGETIDEYGDRVGLFLEDSEREAHLYVIGATGAGKSRALASWACCDLQAGYAFGVLDPHGDLITDILSQAVAWPLLRLIEFGADEMVTVNLLEPIEGIDTFTQTVELVDVFRKIWQLSEESSPRLLEILRNSLWTLIEAGETLLELEPLLTDDAYRERCIRHVSDEPVARFWRDRFGRWPERERTLYVESTLNKASSFIADPRLRLMLGAKKSTLNFREVMDKGQILLVDLSKGVLRTNTNLIGALLLSRIQMAAIGRLKLPLEQRSPWNLYVDEFQNFATDSFAEMLSEARKMGLRLILAHQTLGQLPEKLRSTSSRGRSGTSISSTRQPTSRSPTSGSGRSQSSPICHFGRRCFERRRARHGASAPSTSPITPRQRPRTASTSVSAAEMTVGYEAAASSTRSFLSALWAWLPPSPKQTNQLNLLLSGSPLAALTEVASE